MAIFNLNTDFQAQMAIYLPDNTNEDISEEDVRQCFIDLSDSVAFKGDAQTITGIWTHSVVVKGITPVSDEDLATKSYVDANDFSDARTLTVSGTTNQITVTGGTQDLSADRTWTISLPSDVTITNNVTAADFILSSDMQLKNKLNIIGGDQIEYFGFEYKEGNCRKRYGASAQQVQQVLPEVVTEDDQGFLKVSYIDLHSWEIGQLWNRIKELESKLK